MRNKTISKLRVGDHTRIIPGFPFDSNYFNDEEGVPLIRIRDLLKNSTDTHFVGRYSDEYLVNTGDIIIGMDGDFNIAKWRGSKALLNQRMLMVKTKTGSLLDVNYVYYSLTPILLHINNITAATTVKHLSTYDVSNTFLNAPPIEEQRKIAEILSTVDEQIEQTEALIGKYQAMKKGMMQDLFSRGVDKNGKLRPPYEEAPHLYKTSELGMIPKEWKVRILGDICNENGGSIQTGPFGSQLHAEDYKDAGIPIITVEHLDESQIVHENLPLVGEHDYKRLIKYQLKFKDLVFSRVGAIDRCAFVSKKEDGWLFSGRCLRVRTGNGNLDAGYISYQLNSEPRKLWILNHAVGSTMKCLNTDILSSVPILCPHVDEQAVVAEKLDIISKQVNNEKDWVIKLQKQKQGLMQDLLTGKVPVAV